MLSRHENKPAKPQFSKCISNRASLPTCVCDFTPAKRCSHIHRLCLRMWWRVTKPLSESSPFMLLSTANLQTPNPAGTHWKYEVEVQVAVCVGWSQSRDSFRRASLLPSAPHLRLLPKARLPRKEVRKPVSCFRTLTKLTVIVVFQTRNLCRA